MKASEFAGTYYVKQAGSLDGRIAVGDQIDITWDGVDESTAIITVSSGTETPLDRATFIVDQGLGCLRGDTLQQEGYVMLISRYEQPTSTGSYRALYGAIIQKDPDSVGAWGADDNPGP